MSFNIPNLKPIIFGLISCLSLNAQAFHSASNFSNADKVNNTSIELFTEKLGDKIRDKWAINDIAMWYLDNGYNQWATKLFKLNVTNFPTEGMLWNNLGEAYLASNEFQLANDSFSKSIAFDEGNCSHWCESAKQQLAITKESLSVRSAKKENLTKPARSLVNELGNKVYNRLHINDMGVWLSKNGHDAWAIEIFKLNVENFPYDGNLWDSLGEAYYASLQFELARESFKKALSFASEDKCTWCENSQHYLDIIK